MRNRAILHSDVNCCYAQIECQAHPQLRSHPVVVGGNEETRHGIVLAKNMLAKKAGIKTGETLWQARRKCPGLVVVPPHYELYRKVSRKARMIYYDYTDCVEPFGLDEAWLDVTGSLRLFGMSAKAIACEISERMKAELGVTVSIGVSWNKIFAKFGSDYKKPDAITCITPENYRELVWIEPVRKLLYVGPATERKLHSICVETIGDLAQAREPLLAKRLGKMGLVLRGFARGEDMTDVKPLDPRYADVERIRKSYGNGITFPRDIVDSTTAQAVCWMLSESVAQRLRADRVACCTVEVGVRDAQTLAFVGKQSRLADATCSTLEIAYAAWALMQSLRTLSQEAPVRGLHVRASGIVPACSRQQSLFGNAERRTRLEHLDAAVDDLRRRYGNNIVYLGAKALDANAASMDAMRDNVVHPVSFFHR